MPADALSAMVCYPSMPISSARMVCSCLSQKFTTTSLMLLRQKKRSCRLYHATDVKELHEWMDSACDEHPLFLRVPHEELADDPCIQAVTNETEESKRVA